MTKRTRRELTGALGLLVLGLGVAVAGVGWELAGGAAVAPPPPPPPARARRYVPARALLLGVVEAHREPGLLPSETRLTSEQVTLLLRRMPQIRSGDAAPLAETLSAAQRQEFGRLWPGWIGQPAEWEALCDRLEALLRQAAVESSWIGPEP